MISANQYKLTWDHFNDLNADRRVAFENLCRSLFYRTKVVEEDILHSDPNHPGVEVAPVHSKDGSSMISFQAKYFDGDIGYDQIRHSMEKSVEKYKGILDIIYLYCNKDITSSSKSYQNIEKKTLEAGIKIILVTNQSILEEAMNYPSVLARYFGLDCLDKKWFEQNLQIGLDNLGRRYNSKFNIDTDAQKELSLFLKDDEGIRAINKRKNDAIDSLKNLRWRCDGSYKEIILQLVKSIGNIADVTRHNISEALDWKRKFENESRENLEILSKKAKELQEKFETERPGTDAYNKLRSESYLITKILSIGDYISFSEHEASLISRRVAIVKGEMGTGKSQLLAMSAIGTLEKGRIPLLLLGQTFISDKPIEIQIIQGLTGINIEESFESLLGVMDEIAYETNDYAVLFIDAINESRERDVWKEGINRFIKEVEQYKNILLVISHRTGFEQLLYSDKITADADNGEIATIIHRGLDDESPEGIFDFISNYGIPMSPEFYLQQEMTNPLFLTWFCQTYTGEEHGVYSLIDSVLKQADGEASRAAGYREPLGLLNDLLLDFIDAVNKSVITKKILLGLKSWELYSVQNKIAYINAIERAGVLASYIQSGDEHYYIGYNLLEDYIRADWIIEEYKTEEKIEEYCRTKLLGVSAEGEVTNLGNESVFAMVSAFYFSKFGKECIGIIDCISQEWDRDRLIEEYLKTFTWRNSNLSLKDFIEFINKYQINTNILWNIFIGCATKETSVLNADALTELLSRYSLSKRDYLWTIDINELTVEDRIVSLAYYLEAGNELVGQSDRSIELLLTLFAWMLSSSNRVLRDRISKAMIEVLKRRFNLCILLLNKFKNVNDPYIIQRLYGIIFGAVIKREKSFEKEFENLAITIYSTVFDVEKVYPDILLRDYARLIIERFIFEYPSKDKIIQIEKIRPPYNSEPIPLVEIVDYTDEEFHVDGMWRLLYSMKFDIDVKGVGMYGDFGRYVFQSALREFVGVDDHNIYYYALKHIIDELGYSNELFGNYDSNRADFDRHQSRRIERIGKKYEWITLYNILARLSDSYNVQGIDWNDKIGTAYTGPWNPYVRDFDPTLNIRQNVDLDEFPKFNDGDLTNNTFIDIDASDEEINEWIQSDAVMYSQFPERLIRTDIKGVQWVSMYLYQEIKKTVPGAEAFSWSSARGEQHIWSISAMHIADELEQLTLENLQNSKYINKGSGMNTTRDCYTLFSREYAWSPGYINEFMVDDYEEDTCSIKASSSVINAMWEEQYDASQEETTSYYIPAGDIIRELGLYQKKYDGVFYFKEELAAFDTKVVGDIHGELLIRKDILDLYISKSNKQFFWDVVGEKQFFLGGHGQSWQRREGYFVYKADKVEGMIQIVSNI